MLVSFCDPRVEFFFRIQKKFTSESVKKKRISRETYKRLTQQQLMQKVFGETFFYRLFKNEILLRRKVHHVIFF
jgi:hypothetical protein